MRSENRRLLAAGRIKAESVLYETSIRQDRRRLTGPAGARRILIVTHPSTFQARRAEKEFLMGLSNNLLLLMLPGFCHDTACSSCSTLICNARSPSTCCFA